MSYRGLARNLIDRALADRPVFAAVEQDQVAVGIGYPGREARCLFARFQDDIHTSHTKFGNRLLHIVDSDGYGAASERSLRTGIVRVGA